ncbi:hypothetical protein TNCV_254931 [Trichonephila clavipes]|nr:hypothetical protein TNCV_254931 [Trichonephila clavipes]
MTSRSHVALANRSARLLPNGSRRTADPQNRTPEHHLEKDGNYRLLLETSTLFRTRKLFVSLFGHPNFFFRS